MGNDHLIPWGCSIHLYPDECRLENPSRGIDAKLHVTSSNHILVHDMTEGTEETITDPEEVPAKRSRRGAPRKPRVPRKKPPPAYIQLSPALQSELRKLQHASARGSSAPAADWARVSRAADKALALLLPDKGPRSMEISTVYNCQDIGFECELVKKQSDETQWIHVETVGFGWIPHVKTILRVLNIVDVSSEMHSAIQNLIVRRWDRWKTMTGICDKWENFRQYLMSCRV